MKSFTMGIVTGGLMTALGIGCLLQDQKNYQSIKKKGNKIMQKSKRMARKAENIVEDAVDDLLEL
ncbi:hypothetical protein [Clostridium sp. MD294]|uniref:hypothetical protein n=1 Tax=Clostridium sp. MD294 TaxID=97138 RepID=UPI0002CCCB48|nr:hypothetical protein [Clostridium sp. MD294]NDO47362.1 hypothetical protein [Clostridium sp. MD294]USF29568.1 hypothetical protein C820_000968 [Clostridium sp. MD294]